MSRDSEKANDTYDLIIMHFVEKSSGKEVSFHHEGEEYTEFEVSDVTLAEAKEVAQELIEESLYSKSEINVHYYDGSNYRENKIDT